MSEDILVKLKELEDSSASGDGIKIQIKDIMSSLFEGINSISIKSKLFKTESDLDETLKQELNQVDGNEFRIKVELATYTPETVKKIRDIAMKYSERGYKPSVRVESFDLDLKMSDLESFLDICDELESNGVGLQVNSGIECYDLIDTLIAQEKLDKFADFVNSTNASPLEKYFIIYRYVTSFVYNEREERSTSSRDLVQVLNGDEIVCVGFAQLLEKLCKRAGIKCQCQDLNVYDDQGEHLGGHRNNLVEIRDERYGVNGVFYADACWDSIKAGEEANLSYSYALLPIEDVKHMKKTQIVGKTLNAYLYDNESIEKILLSDNQINLLDFKFNKPNRDFKEESHNPNSNLIQQTRFIMEKFKEYGIPSDYCSKEHCQNLPQIFRVEMFIALAAYNPQPTDYIEKNLRGLKHFVESGFEGDGSKKGYSEKKGIDNVYDELTSFIKNGESSKSNISAFEIETFYENVDKINQFSPYLKKLKQSSKAIKEDVFASAIENSLLKEGYDESHAKVQTKRSIRRTTLRNLMIFDTSATNCFSTSKLAKSFRDKIFQNDSSLEIQRGE